MSFGDAFISAKAEVDGPEFLASLKLQLDKALRGFTQSVEMVPAFTKFHTALVKGLKAETKGVTADVFVTPNFDLFRRELDEGLKGVREPEDVPIHADLKELRAQLASLKAADAIDVPVRAELATLRAQLADLKAGDAIEVPVVADLTFLRAQLATLAGLGATTNAIKVPLTISRVQFTELKERIQAFAKADPINVDIEARLGPGNLKELRTQAGRIAAVRVRATIDNNQFRAALIAAGAQDVPIKITPSGSLKKFRDEIVAYFKRDAVSVDVRAGNLVDFRQSISEATRTTKVPVSLTIGNLEEFRNEARAALERNAALGVSLTVGNTAAFRAEVRAILERPEGYPVNIRPVITPADAAKVRAQAGALGDSAGRTLGERLNKAFSFAFGSLGRNFRQLERTLVGGAAVGEAAFVGIGVAGLAAAGKLELLQSALENIAESTKNTERPLLSAGQNVEQLQQKIIDFALKSPLGVDAVSDAVIRLTSSLKVTGDQALTQINAIAGALAITPDGLNTEGLKGVVKALTQIASAGKLGGQELLQLSNQIPVLARSDIYNNIAKSLIGTSNAIDGVTQKTKKLSQVQLNEVKKIQKAGAISANVALQAVFDSLAVTPGAQKAVDRFNKSLVGTVQRLKETLQFTLASVFLPIVTQVADGLTKIANEVGPALKKSGFADAFARQFSVVTDILVKSIPVILSGIVKIGNSFTSIFKAIGPDGFAKIFSGTSTVLTGVANGIGLLVKLVRGAVAAFRDLNDFMNSDRAFAVSLRAAVGNLRDVFAQLGPIANNVVSAIRDGFVALGPVILPVAAALTFVLDIIAKILASPFGEYLLTLVVIAGTVAAAVAALNIVLGTTVVVATAASAASAALTLRFIAGALASGQFAVALAALRGALVASSAAAGLAALSTTGFVGVAVAAGAIAFVTGEKLGRMIAGFFGAGKASVDAAAQLRAFEAAALVAARATDELTTHVQIATGAIDTFKDSAGNIHIQVTDNFGNVVQRLVGLNSSLAAFRNANRDLLNFNFEELSKAQLRSDAEKAGGKLIGPILPGTSRPDAKNGFGNFVSPADFGIDSDGNGVGGGGAGGAGDAVKSAGEKLADRIKEAKDKILEALVDFGKTVREGSSKEIDTAFKSLRKSLQTIPNFDESGLVKKLRADNAKLDKLADARDALTKRIEDRTSKFNEIFNSLRGGAAEAATQLVAAQKELTDAQSNAATATGDSAAEAATRLKAAQDALRALGVTVPDTIKAAATKVNLALGQLFVNPNGKLNAAAQSGATAFKASLDKRAADLRTFLAEILDLKRKGLSPELLDQLVSAGAGSDLANQLKGASASAVSGLNKTQAEIDKVAAAIAANGAVINEQAEAAATAAGKAVADGLVAGLKANRDKLQTEINLLVKTVIAEVRKGLGIKSPSRVMAAIAAHIPTGLAKGIGDNLHHVTGAVGSMVDAVAATSFAPISLPELNSRALADAQARLNTLSLPKLDARQNLQLQAPTQGPQRMHRDDLAALTNALQQTRVGHTYNTPINAVHIGQAPADPAGFASAIGKAVGRVNR